MRNPLSIVHNAVNYLKTFIRLIQFRQNKIMFNVKKNKIMDIRSYAGLSIFFSNNTIAFLFYCIYFLIVFTTI